MPRELLEGHGTLDHAIALGAVLDIQPGHAQRAADRGRAIRVCAAGARADQRDHLGGG